MDIHDALTSTSATAPYDPRFANTNVIKNCWLHYVEFHNCWANNKDDPSVCASIGAAVNTRCARQQVGVWDKLRMKGHFAGVDTKYQGKNAPDYEEDDE